MTPPPIYPWLVPGALHGIDVSAYQPPSAGLMVAARKAGCVAVDVRACGYDSQGLPFTDGAMLKHLQFARAEALRTSTYAFFHSTAKWQPQADQYLRTYDISGPMAMRPTLDWEDQARVLTNPQMSLDNALAWLAYVGARVDRDPVIYTTKSVVDILISRHVDATPLLAHSLWEAHFRWDPVSGRDSGITAPVPIVIAGKTWVPDAWQCGGTRAPRLEGVKFDTDRDRYLFSSLVDMDRWSAGARSSAVALPPVQTFDVTTARGVQGALVALGETVGAIDGVLGPRTVAAVVRFQHAHGLVADGIVGPRTRAALAAAVAMQSLSPSVMAQLNVEPSPDTPWATPAARTKSSQRMPAVKVPDDEDAPDTEKP